MKTHLRIETHPAARRENIIQGETWRITVLTERLVRVEYSEEGIFTDEPTQVVLNRDFPAAEFTWQETEDGLEVKTEYFKLSYDKKAFSAKGLFCATRMTGEIFKGETRVWHYGDKEEMLRGTARTLDTVNGACELADGILTFWNGCAVLDDSRTLTLTEEGWVEPRRRGLQDVYLFAYGHSYKDALRDFYRLCGKTPMLPRFALGNWWSRYYKYTEESYMELMENFDRENIPFSVAVIDMDWHLVDIDPKYGSGWTGYTWNREFFPDPERFLKKLHDRGMKTTLNVHPADGVRGFEDCYPAVAEAMGADVSREEPVDFDIANPGFMDVYLEKIHHPLEEQGVDFWWIDWQQGTSTKLEGLDPLWMLNHYHYLDSARDKKRPMTFSRYAGPGSHRYPVGFSGDTVITWESLDFQPYFTNSASNIGYGWWSHDIGGHMNGYKNDELEARWYQYGVFSPINRLHSSNNAFSGKEPWRFRSDVRGAMGEFLRLRHQMVPYLYTMNYRAWKDDEPICQPLYYEQPGKWEAYRYKNQYFFGSELMVAPITQACIRGLNVAKVKVWLPEGLWFDIFTGMAYSGNRTLYMHRNLSSIPVLARAGAIVPMTEKISASDVESNPDELTVRVYPGADNAFTLYEDDNVSCAYQKGVCAKTKLQLDWGAKRFSIAPAEGEQSLIPAQRTWKIVFCNTTAKSAQVFLNGRAVEAKTASGGSQLTVVIEKASPADLVEVALPAETAVADNPVKERLYDFLNRAEIAFDEKDQIYRLFEKLDKDAAALLSELQAMDVSEELQKAVLEIVGALR